jgi:ferredoxin
MAARVDPSLMNELKEYGAVDIEKCFNCGNCTAICPLTEDAHPFPRNVIRYMQLGLRGRLRSSLDPWLCYYCGECSDTCPKEAEPAETMMAIRRWLIAEYDTSGHSAKLYTSGKAAWRAILRYSLVPLVLMAIFHITAALGWHDFGGIVTERVELNSFAPVMIVWAIVLIDFGILAGRLFRNLFYMFQLTMGSKSGESPIPLRFYISELKTFLVHTFTQRRWLDCEEKRMRWFKHLLLISGYAIMLLLIVGLLWCFQTDEILPWYHPQRWLGYYATLVLLFASGDALLGRLRKKEQMHKYSHHSDWLFPVFLFTGSLTGIFVHIFRYAGWAWPTYIIYTIHVMFMIAMLDTEVGIGKWTHIFYRPLAMYFDAVKKRATEAEVPAGAVPSPAD